MRKSCIIYANWADQILNLPSDVAGEYIQAILKYAIYGEETETDNTFINAMLIPVKKKLDEDAEAWERTREQRSEAGKRGMANRWHNGVITNDNNVKQSITNITVTDTVTDTVTVKKNNKSRIHSFDERKYDYKELEREIRGNV